MNVHVQHLISAQETGKRLKFLFFWGHTAPKSGSMGAHCFSQWWVAPFAFQGMRYPSAEHWMMAEKARLFGDLAIRDQIIKAESPAEAKKLGRSVDGFDPATWEAEKYRIVVEGNRHKFSAHADLRAFLINTGDRILVEASPVDNVWGIGLAKDAPGIEDPANWKGGNLLGFALMEVRSSLMHEMNTKQS